MATPPFDPVTPEPGLPGTPRDSYPRFMPVAPEPDMIPSSQAPSSQAPVGLDPSTTYHSAAPATASDVTAGTTVKLQVAGGFRPGGNGGGTGNGGGVTLGTAADITIVP